MYILKYSWYHLIINTYSFHVIFPEFRGLMFGPPVRWPVIDLETMVVQVTQTPGKEQHLPAEMRLGWWKPTATRNLLLWGQWWLDHVQISSIDNLQLRSKPFFEKVKAPCQKRGHWTARPLFSLLTWLTSIIFCAFTVSPGHGLELRLLNILTWATRTQFKIYVKTETYIKWCKMAA